MSQSIPNLLEGATTDTVEILEEVPGWDGVGTRLSVKARQEDWGWTDSFGSGLGDGGLKKAHYLALQGNGSAIWQNVGGHEPEKTYTLRFLSSKRRKYPDPLLEV